MKMSTKGRYGLRALIDLAQYSESEPVSITSIAARQGISERYLEQLMSKLKKAGIVTSVRGAGGGYTVLMPIEQISVGAVLRALEGNIEPVDCSGLDSNVGGSCQSSNCCASKMVWQKINDSVNQAVDAIMLDELVNESKKLTESNTFEGLKCE